MSYLLDTHILLWARLDRKKLSADQKAILESREEEKFISTVSVWEVSLKHSVGKLKLNNISPDEFIAGLNKLGIRIITPTPEQYATYYLLPRIERHKDPFDRMIIWHAMQSGLTLLTSDHKFAQYKPHGLNLV